MTDHRREGFAEYSSSYPERTYKDGDKEAYQITFPVGYLEQQGPNKDEMDKAEQEPGNAKHFRLKKWQYFLAIAVAVVAIFIGITVGVVVGVRNSKSSSPSGLNSTELPNSTSTTNSTETPNSNSTVNSDLAVGGYLGPEYYSKSGAWNGTGIATALAEFDYTDLYAFYQDCTGDRVCRSALLNKIARRKRGHL